MAYYSDFGKRIAYLQNVLQRTPTPLRVCDFKLGPVANMST